jgi:thiosulfate dehydrogenase [quinone] large subunit
MDTLSINHKNNNFELAGLFSLALRLIIGWTYFSAFWRRLFLANKLDPESAGYIGEKFNHFLPNALGIKPIIEYMVTNPEVLWWSMTIFTIVEGIVGLLLMFGFFTRLMSLGVIGLAMGILLGSGWIGTTCLDEWQIGILGLAGGFTLFYTGSGQYSLDYWFMQKKHVLTKRKWFSWLASGVLPLSKNQLSKSFLTGALVIFSISLYTNQVFHGGLWGPLHNKSVKPKVELSELQLQNEAVSFQVYRVEGVDVYGSFLIGIEVIDQHGNSIYALNGSDLANFPESQISNNYVTKVKSGAHSLIIPLGAKATIKLQSPKFKSLSEGKFKVKLTDISGAEWVI